MSRSKITSASIEDSTIAAADIASGAVEGAITSPLSHRNLVINGDMRIDQRYGGSSNTVGPNQHGWSIDRFRPSVYGTSGQFSWYQETDAPAGFYNSLKMTVLATDNFDGTYEYGRVIHRFEGLNTRHLKWQTSDAKTITVSFWVKCSEAGTFGFSVMDAPYTAAYTTTYDIDTANTWEYKTITIPGPTTSVGTFNNDNSLSFSTQWMFGGGTAVTTSTLNTWQSSRYEMASTGMNLMAVSGATWQITGVQVEEGTTATPFEHRSYDEELARCQRYYHRNDNVVGGKSIGSGFFYNSTVGFTHYDFPVEMRTAPSKSFSGLSDFRVLYGTGVKTATDSETISGRNGARLGWTVSGATAGQGMMVDCNNSTGWIAFDAEM